MSEKFGNNKIKKNNFYKNKNLFKIDNTDANKILVSRIEPYGKKSDLNTLLDIVIMMSLEHYA